MQDGLLHLTRMPTMRLWNLARVGICDMAAGSTQDIVVLL